MKAFLRALLIAFASWTICADIAGGLPPVDKGTQRQSRAVLIATNSGTLRGRIRTSRGGEHFYAFTGIPYAEKTRRFEVAKPVKAWHDIRDARNYSSICPQVKTLGNGEKIIEGDEDCLYLNVYLPASGRCEDPKQLPVMFHIHGGAFVRGSGQKYDPVYFMDECIVIVSINYRLGALGFLTTEDEEIPGNLGLKDALLALKWTRENIHHFGGNKDAITIIGFSAGAAMASHFIASRATRGLFHRVIAMSGSSLDQFAVVKNPRKNAFRLGGLLHCSADMVDDLVRCLKAADVRDIVLQQANLKKWLIDEVYFAPVVEPQNATDPFQTVNPYLRYKRGEANRVPLITGIVKDEGLLYAEPLLRIPAAIQQLNQNWNALSPLLYQYDFLNISEERRNNISEQIREFYLNGNPVDRNVSEGFINSASDRYFNFGMQEESILHSKYAPVYQYVITFQGNFSLASTYLKLPYIAVSHADDIRYIFRTTNSVPQPKIGSKEFDFSQNLVRLWASFVKTGRPESLYPNAPVWKEFDASRPTLQLDFPSKIIHGIHADRMAFWQNLKLREQEFPQDLDY